MNKINRWFRKKYIMWKYKHNWNTGKIIVLGEHDRAYGLTTMMMKDCIENDYVLFVPYEADKKAIFPSAEEREKYSKYLLSKMDIKMGAHLGKNIQGVIMDNHCSYEDIKFLHGSDFKIVNGFIYMSNAA